MDPVFVAEVNGLRIMELAFGGAAVYSPFGRLIEAFNSVEDAFRFVANLPLDDQSPQRCRFCRGDETAYACECV